MAVTLSVGLNKKIGQPDYGSLCASCHVEFEIDRTLLDGDLEGFHHKVRSAFAACQQSVEEQLSRQQAGPASMPTNGFHQNGHHTNGNGHSHANGNAHQNGNGSGQTNGRLATASQVRAIHAIANKARIDLPSELNQRFGVSRPDDLTLSQASELIDAIKPQTNGTGGRR
ncbi:hypothetical protein [Rubinisphaera sp.]|uniref:hypothetical protein n=1 Tax=Rubinisphaera sp. TaxID=2024857 RepID=UPI000C11E27A|nr:hypothetical protein [Rubinisphaera sp.]MBV09486.1 hypothetical protein [Rubinisphaera sp.]|tara:strand:+ start:1514 stop:2023 length:510 start_codon:yes stop_codon:yes gene_type:complete